MLLQHDDSLTYFCLWTVICVARARSLLYCQLYLFSPLLIQQYSNSVFVLQIFQHPFKCVLVGTPISLLWSVSTSRIEEELPCASFDFSHCIFNSVACLQRLHLLMYHHESDFSCIFCLFCSFLPILTAAAWTFISFFCFFTSTFFIFFFCLMFLLIFAAALLFLSWLWSWCIWVVIVVFVEMSAEKRGDERRERLSKIALYWLL